jgi:hypothetical protein
MALAFTRYSADYVQDEAKAKAARIGVHLPASALPKATRPAPSRRAPAIDYRPRF